MNSPPLINSDWPAPAWTGPSWPGLDRAGPDRTQLVQTGRCLAAWCQACACPPLCLCLLFCFVFVCMSLCCVCKPVQLPSHPPPTSAWSPSNRLSMQRPGVSASGTSNRPEMGEGGVDKHTLHTAICYFQILSLIPSSVRSSFHISSRIFMGIWLAAFSRGIIIWPSNDLRADSLTLNLGPPSGSSSPLVFLLNSLLSLSVSDPA